jgi:preprotein translocase subunit SecD
LWKNLLSTDLETNVLAWLDAVRSERHFGSVENARNLLFQAINANLDEPYQLYEYFVQFEREEGTREQVDAALEKINTRVNQQQQQQPRNQRRKKDRVPAKPAKNEKTKQRDKPRKDVPPKQDEQPKKAEKRKANGQSEPESSKKVAKLEEEPKKEPFKFSTGKENNKLFVRNVDFASTEEELREFFGKYGEIVGIRIICFKNGKPKGIAYVEFVDDNAANAGLAANNQEFRGNF